MKSVADELAKETAEAALALSVEERIASALRLGRQAVELYASTHGLGLEEARLELRRRNQIGRRPSACASFDE